MNNININQIRNINSAPELIEEVAHSIQSKRRHKGHKYLILNEDNFLSTTTRKRNVLPFVKIVELVEELLTDDKMNLLIRDNLIQSFKIITDYEKNKLKSPRKKLFAKNKIEQVKNAQRIIAIEKGKFKQIKETHPFFAPIRKKLGGKKVLEAVKIASRITKGVNEGAFTIGETYFSEVFDRMNRYAGGDLYDKLFTVWNELGPKAGSFNEWCQKLESGERVLGYRDPRLQNYIGPNPKINIPPVHYINEDERHNYLIRVDEKGLICDSHFQPYTTVDIDTPQIFVVGLDDQIYIATKKRGKKKGDLAFNHTSFFSGGAVKAAGSLIIKNGVIEIFSNASGHYSTEQSEENQRKMMINALKAFENMGFDLSKVTLIYNREEAQISSFLEER